MKAYPLLKQAPRRENLSVEMSYKP